MGFAKFVASVGMVAAMGFPQAALIDRGGGMVFDNALNVTWLQDANYAKTSGYDADGLLTWSSASVWVTGLTYGGYTDWRLPTSNASCNSFGGEVTAKNCMTSELGSLFYISLGNFDATQPGGGLQNVGLFVNLFGGHGYWTSTGFDSYGYYFHMASGYQAYSSKENLHYALAVRDGDVSTAVPAPATIILMLTGIGLLGLTKRRLRKEV